MKAPIRGSKAKAGRYAKPWAELFAQDVAKIGPPVIGAALTPAQIADFEAHVPKPFVALLRAYGFGYYAKRRYQFVDPAGFHPVLEQLFEGDAEIDASSARVTGVSGFGEFDIWMGSYFSATLDLRTMTLRCAALAPDELALPVGFPAGPPSLDPDVRVRMLLPYEPKKVDFLDVMNKPQFNLAQKALRPLEAGEIYAFDPPLAETAGAMPRHPLERMVRLNAVMALEAAAQTTPLRLVRTVRGKPEEVRRIGTG